MKKTVFLLFITLLLNTCTSSRLNFDRGIIPPVPVNFASVNSSYDDYNSDLQITWATMSFTLIFSTNRKSLGNDFDFIGYNGIIYFDLIDGAFEMQTGQATVSLLEAVNTGNNELGPWFTADYPYYRNSMGLADDRRFFYTSDPDGNMDLFSCGYDFADEAFKPSGDPFALTALNTGHNEGYFSIHYGATVNRETAYFMSDRDGSYDIYSATGEEGKLITESASVIVNRSSVLSSSADDKCPFVSENVIVFTSDREGGFGGFDLYYSVYNGQEWSAPVNMGDLINTEYDEYRPVVVSTGEMFINDLMIFSSNRPGGKGGFDLYYVGIPQK